MSQAISPIAVGLSANKPVKKIDFNLESLRGFAAIIVIWYHVILYRGWLDPQYNPTGIFSFIAPGHLSVLVFFVLSGYVIGLNHLQPLRKSEITLYLKKRFTRLYPIYFVSMIFAILVARKVYPFSTIIGNLTMMQQLLVPTIMENNPGWSLNYEVLFYLLFIPLSFFRVNVLIATVVVGGLGVFTAFQGQGYVLGSTYAIGLSFWLCGVILAKYFQRPAKTSFALMVSMLFLLISLGRFNVIHTLLSRVIIMVLGSDANSSSAMIKFLDFTYLPYCLVMVLVFASKDFAYKKLILPILLLSPAYTLYYILHTPSALHDPSLLLPSMFYVLSVAIYLLQKPLEYLGRIFIERLSATGAISYGLYMIHFPIIAVFARINLFSGTPITFSVRALLYLISCISTAWFLEKKFQPWFKNRLL
jgi:peptidoglycan/LPS O-acetylase OafA/YrhL